MRPILLTPILQTPYFCRARPPQRGGPGGANGHRPGRNGGARRNYATPGERRPGLHDNVESQVLVLVINGYVSDRSDRKRPLFLAAMLPRTLIFLSCWALVNAGSANKGDSCLQSDSRLQTGTFQFFDDCNSVTYCASNNTCLLKGCRKDEFPFGYQKGAHLPDLCPTGQFCPDEADECQALLPVNSPCQLNRDGKPCTPFGCSLSCSAQMNARHPPMLQSSQTRRTADSTSTVQCVSITCACMCWLHPQSSVPERLPGGRTKPPPTTAVP